MYLTAYNFSCYGYFSTRTRTCQQEFSTVLSVEPVGEGLDPPSLPMLQQQKGGLKPSPTSIFHL